MGKNSHYAAGAEARPVPICPTCGGEAAEFRTTFGIKSTCCGLWSWDRYPLVSAETHQARSAAHRAFDVLWKSKLMTRRQAYAALGRELKLPKGECHIKFMDVETAGRVPQAVERIRGAYNV